MKNYSLIKAILSIFFIATAINLDAVCISIDRFKAPCGVNIYLFGDVHVGDTASIMEEQNAFLAAAREKGAFCIVEDLDNYIGDNHAIRNCVQDKNASRLRSIDEISRGVTPDGITKMATALRGLTDMCAAQKIPCFNAECRHAALPIQNGDDSHKYDAEQLDIEIDKLIKDMSSVAQAGIEDDKACLKNFYVTHLHSLYHLGNDKTPQQLIHGAGLVAVNMQIISQLQNLLSKYQDGKIKDEDKRDIFIFAGAVHIQLVIQIMEQQLHCVEQCFGEQGKYALDMQRFDAFSSDMISLASNPKDFVFQDQVLAREHVNKHKVDIAEFFRIEKQNERAFTGFQVASREETAAQIRQHISSVGKERLEKYLLDAVQTNDTAALANAIERGANINCAIIPNFTPLMLASIYGYAETVQLLLNSGADINDAKRDGGTALVEAFTMGRLGIAKILLEHDAEVNMKLDQDGRTLLMRAAGSRSDNPEAVEMLIARGADINAVTKSGKTALSIARSNCNDDIAKVLIAAGAER